LKIKPVVLRQVAQQDIDEAVAYCLQEASATYPLGYKTAQDQFNWG
jgi:hypothetical protein